MAIKRFEELDKVESLEMSKCEMENVVARAPVAKKDARLDLLMKELESQKAQFELAAVGAKIELATVQQRMLAAISDVSTSATAPSVIDPTWVLPPGARAPHLNVPVATISDVSTSATAPRSVIDPTWVLLPGARAPHLNVPVVTTPRAVSIEVSVAAPTVVAMPWKQLSNDADSSNEAIPKKRSVEVKRILADFRVNLTVSTED